MAETATRHSAGRDQTCKQCGSAGGFNFRVADEIWEAVVPPHLHRRVVCLRCFDRFASAQGVRYADHLREIYFAGDIAAFKLRVEWAAERGS